MLARIYSAPTLISAAWSVVVREPIFTTSPNGTTAKVISTGNSARNGASAWRNLSAPSGTKSSLVKSFSGSAISVLTTPKLGRPIRLPSPVMSARLAPMRSWMSALPLRSIQSRIAEILRATTTTTIALMASIRRSIITAGKLVYKSVGGYLDQLFVLTLVLELDLRRGDARGSAAPTGVSGNVEAARSTRQARRQKSGLQSWSRTTAL